MGDTEAMTTPLDRMEEVADWLHSDNPCLRQIAEQTVDQHLGPAILAQMELLREQRKRPLFQIKLVPSIGLTASQPEISVLVTDGQSGT